MLGCKTSQNHDFGHRFEKRVGMLYNMWVTDREEDLAVDALAYVAHLVRCSGDATRGRRHACYIRVPAIKTRVGVLHFLRSRGMINSVGYN